MKPRTLEELAKVFDVAKLRIKTIGEYNVFSMGEMASLIKNDPVLSKIIMKQDVFSEEETAHFANFFFTCGVLSAMEREKNVIDLKPEGR